VKRLWDVCQIPDFRNVTIDAHVRLLQDIYRLLQNNTHRLPDDYMNKQVSRLDETSGGVDILSSRLAQIRTWTYCANKVSWMWDASHWISRTREVEDRLSDALHESLIARFVDRRTSALLKNIGMGTVMETSIKDSGEVWVDGHGKIAPSGSVFNPDAELIGGALGNPNLQTLAVNRMRDFLRAEVTTKLEPLTKLKALSESTEALPSTRGFAFSLLENFGFIDRSKQGQIVKDLDQDARKQLREVGAYFGQYTVFMREMIKPKPSRLLSLLLSYGAGGDKKPFIPFAGMTSIPNEGELASDNYSPQAIAIAGYRACGPLSGLVRQAMNEAGGRKFQIMQEMLALLGSSYEDACGVLNSLGYKSERVTPNPSQKETDIMPEAQSDGITPKNSEATESIAQTEKTETAIAKNAPKPLNPYIRRSAGDDGTMIELTDIELWHMPFKKRGGDRSQARQNNAKRYKKDRPNNNSRGKQNNPRDANQSSKPKPPALKMENSPFAALAALKNAPKKD